MSPQDGRGRTRELENLGVEVSHFAELCPPKGVWRKFDEGREKKKKRGVG